MFGTVREFGAGGFDVFQGMFPFNCRSQEELDQLATNPNHQSWVGSSSAVQELSPGGVGKRLTVHEVSSEREGDLHSAKPTWEPTSTDSVGFHGICVVDLPLFWL